MASLALVKEGGLPQCKPIVHVNIDSTQAAVSASLRQVFIQLYTLGLPEEALSSAEIVLAEVLNNIVEHAYQNQADQNIALWIGQAKKRLNFKVVDQGQPLPDLELPAGKATDLDVQTCDLPEGGFGWFLIKSLAKDISYNRHPNENEIQFAIEV